MAKFYILNYDIKECPGKMQNPSGELRRVAIRVNLSAWLIRDDLMPHNVINELSRYRTEGKVRWILTPVDEKGVRETILYAAENMREEVLKQRARCDKLIEDGPKEQTTAALEHWQGLVQAALVRLQTLIDDHRRAAELYEIGRDVLDFRKATHFMQRVRDKAEYQARVYIATIHALPENDPIRQAAEANLVPAEVLADYAQDNGAEALGEELAETTR